MPSTVTPDHEVVIVGSGFAGLGSALTKFVIPASEVARFRDQLDLAGIDERRLFPDLDSVAAQMRRYYS